MYKLNATLSKRTQKMINVEKEIRAKRDRIINTSDQDPNLGGTLIFKEISAK